jgi:hypothetical protein
MVAALLASAQFTRAVTLAWDLVPGVAGYRIYYGQVSRLYASSVDVGNSTSMTVSGLTSGVSYYFAVTAYDQQGFESDFSFEISYTVPPSGSTSSIPDTESGTAQYLTSQTFGTVRNGYSGFLGMQILVGSNPITVTTLGRMMLDGNNSVHTVKFVNASDGTDVPGGTASIEMAGGTVNQFQYANLSSPVVLTAGTAYYLVSEETADGDTWYYDDTLVGTSSVATELSGAWGNGPGQWNVSGSAGQSYGPLDFKYLTTTPPTPPTTPPASLPYITGQTNAMPRNGFTGFAGMQIRVGLAPLFVTSLGRMMLDGNNSTHLVKLVNADDGTDIPGGSVSISMSGGTAGTFLYADLINPILLQAGTAYYVVSEETSGGDTWYYNTSVVTTSAATEISAAWGHDDGQWNTSGSFGQTYGPVDFKYNLNEPGF